jgi:hypothetical protein
MSVKKSDVTECDYDRAVWPHVMTVEEGQPPLSYRRGYIVTHYGIVAFYDQPGEHAHTRLEVVLGYRCHTRTIARTFTQRGLLTVAGRFAREVSWEQP